jgi:hypothetical protein
MPVKSGVRIGEAKTKVATHEYWVNGQTNVDYSLENPNELSNPHQNQSIEMSVFLDDDGKGATLTLNRHFHTYLGGVWEASTSNHITLLSHESLTIDEIRMLAETLTTFVNGIDSGVIKPDTE